MTSFAKATWDCRKWACRKWVRRKTGQQKQTDEKMDIYLLEAVINGILLGGVLALLALGLNLIFGVIDVVWIAYADLVMCGMYVLFWLYAELGWPLPLACGAAVVGVAGLGGLVRLLVVRPLLAP